jgi:hypothetical protein
VVEAMFLDNFNDLSTTQLKGIAKEISLIYDKFNTLSDQKKLW